MSVALLLITHRNVGNAVLETAKSAFGELPLSATAICVGKDVDPPQLTQALSQKINELDQGDGVLILTDIFGSTPSNIGRSLLHKNQKARLLAGVNVPMIIRIMNYPEQPLEEMVKTAIIGGNEGIMEYEPPSNLLK